MYTRRGDKGETSLFGSKRVSKDSPRIEAYGAIDELNSCIGVAISFSTSESLSTPLKRVQKLLFVAGADLATELAARGEGETALGATALRHHVGEDAPARISRLRDPVAVVAEMMIGLPLLAGMSAGETHDTIRLLERIAGERGLTLLFTEHDMDVVFSIAQKIAVLHQGRLIADGSPQEVRNDPEVRRVYLGHSH